MECHGISNINIKEHNDIVEECIDNNYFMFDI